MYISFNYPSYLVIILVIPVFILFHFLSLKRTKRRALNFANFEAISRVRGVDLFSKNIVNLFLSVTIAFLIIFSLAGLTLHREAYASEFSFVLAIDTSSSMDATDMSPNRLEAAKERAIEFVDSVPSGTKIGVLSFSGNSFIERDLTENKEMVKEAIRGIEKSYIEGTDVYEAIITSTNILKGEDSRVMVLLSDGQITIGDIADSIAYANENNVIIHTIAIGTKEGGETKYGISKLDEESLKALAYNTGGEYFEATDKEKLADSFNQVTKATKKKVSTDLSSYALLLALSLFIIDYILINTRYKIFP